MTCNLCNGSGLKSVLVTHKYTKIQIFKTEVCPCRLSALISQEQPILSFLEDRYLDDKLFDNRLKFNPAKLRENPNYLIRGGYENLCLHVKGLMMRHRFDDPKPLFLFCRSIDILHDYYVQQNDGSSPHLSETDKFALIVISLDTRENNTKLKDCISQVVYTRLKDRKPTWLFIPEGKNGLSECQQEYSKELTEYTAGYRSVDLAMDYGSGQTQQAVRTNTKLSDFGGLQ